MKIEEYCHGRKGQKYGIWNSARKCFQFGICEDTPQKAVHRLREKIGKDSYKWRFEPRALPSSMDGKPCTMCSATPKK